MSESTTLVLIATVYVPTFIVWAAAITAALILPQYLLRSDVPWPVCAVMILALMVLATVMTGVVVRGVAV